MAAGIGIDVPLRPVLHMSVLPLLRSVNEADVSAGGERSLVEDGALSEESGSDSEQPSGRPPSRHRAQSRDGPSGLRSEPPRVHWRISRSVFSRRFSLRSGRSSFPFLGNLGGKDTWCPRKRGNSTMDSVGLSRSSESELVRRFRTACR